MKKIVNIINWINFHCSDVSIIGVFIFSLLPFFIDNHGHNFYTFYGIVCAFVSTIFVRWQVKDGIKTSKLYNILCMIIVFLGAISIYFLSGKNEKTPYTDFELCISTYFGGIIGLIIGTFISDFIDKEREEKNRKRQSELNSMNRQKEKKEILETYNWVKVEKYKDDESLSWEERYKKLEKHHIEETDFLIKKIRDIVNKYN